MPLIFREDTNEDLRYIALATVPAKTGEPTHHIIDDLGPADLPDNPARLIISNHPGQDRDGRDVRGQPDDPQKHSRHMRASDVTLAETDPPVAEDE